MESKHEHMESHVYVVVGCTGEYSDWTEWLVVAFPTEKQAEDRVKELEAWLQEVGYSMGGPNISYYADDNNLVNPLDPYFKVYYTGTRYYISRVLLED